MDSSKNLYRFEIKQAVQWTLDSLRIDTETHEIGVTGYSTCESYNPFCWHGLTEILTWISIRAPSKVWNEMTYPIPNVNGAA